MEIGQVFSLIENANGSVVLKIDDQNYLTETDTNELIVQEENKDKEGLLFNTKWLG